MTCGLKGYPSFVAAVSLALAVVDLLRDAQLPTNLTGRLAAIQLDFGLREHEVGLLRFEEPSSHCCTPKCW
jgi:hypothetical protein